MRSYTTAETAKLIRSSLKKSFPATKFSVKSKSYSGGSSINIYWTDGPSTKAVEAITAQFEGKGFDGMIDLSYSIDAWVLNGEIIGTRSRGTEGSMGVVPAWGLIAPHDDAELVDFGGSYIFTNRRISATFANKLIPVIAAYWGGVTEIPTATDGYFGFELGDATYRPVRADLSATRDSWRACIHEASENRARYLRTND